MGTSSSINATLRPEQAADPECATLAGPVPKHPDDGAPFPAAKGAQHPQIEVQRGHRRGHSGPAGSPAPPGTFPPAARTLPGRHHHPAPRPRWPVRACRPSCCSRCRPCATTHSHHRGTPNQRTCRTTSRARGRPTTRYRIAEPPGHHPTCGADRSCRDHRHRPGAPDGARGISIGRKRNSASPHRPAGEQPVNEPRRPRPRPGVVVGSAEWPSCGWSPRVPSRSPRNGGRRVVWRRHPCGRSWCGDPG